MSKLWFAKWPHAWNIFRAPMCWLHRDLIPFSTFPSLTSRSYQSSSPPQHLFVILSFPSIIYWSIMGLFDLETHFAFYGAYHSNPTNILIHTFFVWPIFFTSLVLFYFTPSLLSLTPPQLLPIIGVPFTLNFGFFFALLYAAFYVSLDRKAGSLAALVCLLCWVGSCVLASHLGFSLAWKVFFLSILCFFGLFLFLFLVGFCGFNFIGGLFFFSVCVCVGLEWNLFLIDLNWWGEALLMMMIGMMLFYYDWVIDRWMSGGRFSFLI